MMPSERTTPADAGKTSPYRIAVPGAPAPGGWSVFLCDGAGNVIDHTGTACGPSTDDQDLPPGHRLLFIRK